MRRHEAPAVDFAPAPEGVEFARPQASRRLSEGLMARREPSNGETERSLRALAAELAEREAALAAVQASLDEREALMRISLRQMTEAAEMPLLGECVEDEAGFRDDEEEGWAASFFQREGGGGSSSTGKRKR